MRQSARLCRGAEGLCADSGDAIELPEEIDAKRAAEAAERAKERLLHKQSIMQYYHSQAALNRA